MKYRDTTFGEVAVFSNGKKRPSSTGQYQVFGASGVIGTTNNTNAPKNSIIIGRVGTCGSVNFSREKCWVSDNAILVTPKENIDIRWLYYALIYSRIPEYKIGSTQPLITQNILKSIEIKTPDLETQKKVVRILSAFDDKIELNKKISNSLQDYLKATFIQFQKTHELKTINLKDVFNFQEGPGIRNWQYVTKDGIRFINIRCIKGDDIDLSTANMIATEEAEGKYAHFLLKEGDVIVSTSGTLGRSQIIRKSHLPLCLNTSVIRFWPKNDVMYSYMYNYLISEEFLHKLDIMATGSAQRNFGPTHLEQLELSIPKNKSDMGIFEKTTRPIIDKMLVIKDENTTLARIRNTILPQLMNNNINLGKVRI